MPTLPSIPPLGLTHGEERLVLLLPQLWAASFQSCPCLGSSEEGASLAVASLALLVRLNLSPSLRKAARKGVLHPLWLPRQVGLGGGAKLCLFPRLRLCFPQAWALCHSRRGENRASLSASIGPGATALREPCCSRCAAGEQIPVAKALPGGTDPAMCRGWVWVLCSGLEEWGTGVSAACCGRVTALGLAGGFCCVRGRAEVGLGCGLGRAARWCALELGAVPGGRGMSPELAGPSFLGLSGQLACTTFLLWRLSGLSLTS